MLWGRWTPEGHFGATVLAKLSVRIWHHDIAGMSIGYCSQIIFSHQTWRPGVLCMDETSCLVPTRRKPGTRQFVSYVGENLWKRISASISGVWCGTWCIAAIFAHRPAVSKILGEKKIFSVSLARKENIRKISIIKYEDNISQDNKRYRSHMTFSEQPEGGWMCGWWMRMKACPPFCFVNISGRIWKRSFRSECMF